MFTQTSVGILHILETMGVEARIYQYNQTVHTFLWKRIIRC